MEHKTLKLRMYFFRMIFYVFQSRYNVTSLTVIENIGTRASREQRVAMCNSAGAEVIVETGTPCFCHCSPHWDALCYYANGFDVLFLRIHILCSKFLQIYFWRKETINRFHKRHACKTRNITMMEQCSQLFIEAKKVWVTPIRSFFWARLFWDVTENFYI